LAGFIPDFSGDIAVNDIPLNAHNINEIRKLIAWLPQETALNFKSVKELFYAPFVSKDLLSKENKDISGGQRQRIILASCLLLNKPILLLDEPTSALDEKIKRKIADYIFNKNNLTVVAATHDSYWIKNSDLEIKLT